MAVGVLEAAKSTWILLNTPETQGDCPCLACGSPQPIHGHPTALHASPVHPDPFRGWHPADASEGWESPFLRVAGKHVQSRGTRRRHAHLSKQHNPRERKWEAVHTWSGFAGSRGDMSSPKAPYPAREQEVWSRRIHREGLRKPQNPR